MAEYRSPSDDQVKAALRRIVTPQLKRAFFEGLKNPLWVAPLLKHGVFSNPPEPEILDDGLVREEYWPEGDYLLRAARDVPKEVVDVLLTLGASTNSWVLRATFAIAATLPPASAARLQPLVKSWRTTGFGWRTDPRNLVTVTLNLLEGGQYETGIWFANLIFSPDRLSEWNQPQTLIDEYAFVEALPKITSALGPAGLSTVLGWLERFERLAGNVTDGSDTSYVSRESIRVSGESIDGKEQILIDAVRDLAVVGLGIDPRSTFNSLTKSRMILSRKILLFALGKVIEASEDRDENLPELLELATELLYDEESSNDACRIDYAELARAVAEKSLVSLDPLVEYIQSGPRVDRGQLREWIARYEQDGDVESQVQEYVDQWKHRWLSSIGYEALPAILQSELAAFDGTFGVIDNPLNPSRLITSWTGPNSPLTQIEMASMSPTELVSHLESWHYRGVGLGPEPSHEGQARVLTSLISSNPSAFDGVENLTSRLRPTYLRAILQGWEAAIKNDLSLNLEQAATFVSQVLSHADEASFDSEGGAWDDDSNFRAAKQAAVSFLLDVVKKHEELAIPTTLMNDFARMLISSASDEIAWAEYISYGDDGSSDPMTVSLNWQWPIRLRALVYLLAFGPEATWYREAEAALDSELARNDSRGASRAVIGESLARLVNSESDWLNENLLELFGDQSGLTTGQQIALTTGMAIHYYHRTLYELLTPSMLGALLADGPIIAGWRSDSNPVQRIGEWAVSAIIFGHRTMEDPVASTFFERAPSSVRGRALGRTAWQFMHAPSVDDSIRERLEALWDQRVSHVRSNPNDSDELNEFYWFVKSGKFPVEWWLPRLREAVELSPSLATQRYFIGKELATSADVDASTAFEVLKLLIDGRDENGVAIYDLSQNAVPMVLARAIASEDDELREAAQAYMNHLGELGDLSLERKVLDVIEGRVSQDDVG